MMKSAQAGRNYIQERGGLTEQLKRWSALIMLAVILLINSIFTQNFFSVSVIWTIITQCCTIILTGMGMTMVISTGGIDISVGSVVAAAAVFNAIFLPLGIVPAMLISLALCAVIGLINGFMIGKLAVSPMVVTLAMLILARGVAQVVNDGKIIYLTQYPDFLNIGQGKLFGVVPTQILPIVLVVGAIFFIMEKTAWGRRIQAVGDNPRAARLSGLNSVMTIISVYVVSAVLSGIAGIMLSSKVGAADGNTLGKLAELDAIAAVAVGGTSMSGGRAKVLGTLVGAVIMQLITISIVMNNITYEYAQVLKAIIIIFAVYIQRETRS
jgi:ribose transport system permease protein